MFRTPRNRRIRSWRRWLPWLPFALSALAPLCPPADGGHPMKGDPMVICPTNGRAEPASMCYGTGH